MEKPLFQAIAPQHEDHEQDRSGVKAKHQRQQPVQRAKAVAADGEAHRAKCA